MRTPKSMRASTMTSKEVRNFQIPARRQSCTELLAELGGYGGLVGKVETVAKMNHNGEVNR